MSKHENKQELRDIREEMFDDEDAGPLYIDEKYKEEGYVYRIVDAERPGRVQNLIKKGYEIVENAELSSNKNSVGGVNQLGSTVTIQLGTNTSRNGILMRIRQDLYERRQEAKRKRNQENENSMGNTSIPTQFGEITVGDKTYKK